MAEENKKIDHRNTPEALERRRKTNEYLQMVKDRFYYLDPMTLVPHLEQMLPEFRKNPRMSKTQFIKMTIRAGIPAKSWCIGGKQGRDRTFQAILPLWGKMLNVEKTRLDKVLSNDKLQPIISTLGTGIADGFDLTKLRYDKIIIMADADVDGSHIRTLILTFFFRYMCELIEKGHVYIACSPLYKISKKDQISYAYSEEDKKRILKKIGGHGTVIQRYKGLGEMNPEQLWETTMNPEKRTLVQITSDDAVEANEIFSILMGDAVAPRRQFIEQHASFVKNIDV